jgi:2-polyprenyl-6-hydroxyphenyl methylase/3-demethylubiquinone-9 3-methyltransferase
VKRDLTHQELCHERLALREAWRPSGYDTRRRVEVLTREFLSKESLQGRSTLDVGCGLGDFSESLAQSGACVVACDIGPTLVEQTRRRVGCAAEVADALALEDHFGSERFDLVVSSECIEHTPEPEAAVRQMVRVLKPGGLIVLSTPNWLWYPVVRFASLARLRPYDGHENFSSWSSLRGVLRANGVRVEAEKGLHLFPFQLGLHRLSRWCDEHLQAVRGLMINICILGRKER